MASPQELEQGIDVPHPEPNTISTPYSSSISSEIADSTPAERSNSETSWGDDQFPKQDESAISQIQPPLETLLSELFTENIIAKIFRTAIKHLPHANSGKSSFSLNPEGKVSLPWPIDFPEIVPQEGPRAGHYQLREPEFWTCGFFPGTLYALLERTIKYPHSINLCQDPATINFSIAELRAHLLPLCKAWSSPLHSMSSRTDTHDIGFIIMPALRRDWELMHNPQSLQSIILAARSLATRYVSGARAIRSWDCLLKKDITVTDQDKNCLVIIDSICNLDLLFYASEHSGDESLREIATTHARTLMETHLRAEVVKDRPKKGYQGQLYSTCHVGNLDPGTGRLRWRKTAQGYADESTWARGQSWAIMGYAQTYMWTKDTVFLEAACGVAEYFLHRMDTAPSNVEIPFPESDVEGVIMSDGIPRRTRGRYVPLWDFDAPIEDPSSPLRDSSAGVIAANGMLILSQALAGLQQHDLSRRFFEAAIEIVKDTINLSLAAETAGFVKGSNGGGDSQSLEVADVTAGGIFEALLKHGTANNNKNARRQYRNHGLVYGDYYLVDFGNRLMQMGVI